MSDAPKPNPPKIGGSVTLGNALIRDRRLQLMLLGTMALTIFGVGQLPDTVMSALVGHRRLGIHSGLITDGVMRLMQSGVVDKSAKGIERGVSDWADRRRNRAQVALASSHYPPPRGRAVGSSADCRVPGLRPAPTSRLWSPTTESPTYEAAAFTNVAIADHDHQDDLFHHWHLDWSAVSSPTD
jgi:hypothetical protein